MKISVMLNTGIIQSKKAGITTDLLLTNPLNSGTKLQ